MIYVEAPVDYVGDKPIHFIAGGISSCPDWQTELVSKLTNLSIAILNPRRKDFPMGNKDEGMKQIVWEDVYLGRADTISFWFPKETLCPITLFELGSWSMNRGTKIFVGCHPDYQRRFDIETQLFLRQPNLEIVYDINSLAEQIIQYYTIT